MIFAPTLRVLRLVGYRFPALVAPPSFPLLKKIVLYDVGISEDSLQGIISGCATLESLGLHTTEFGRLCIRSPTLRSIRLDAPGSQGAIQELVIEDAPSLQRLLPTYSRYGPIAIRVIRAPKWEILGFLSECISTLQLGTPVFQVGERETSHLAS
jgi:hypothetical protein